MRLFEALKRQGEGRKAWVERQAKIQGAKVFFNTITNCLDPNNHDYDEDIKRKMALGVGEKWLEMYAKDISPKIDELEIQDNLVAYHPEHDSRSEHQRCTLEDIGNWITEQESLED